MKLSVLFWLGVLAVGGTVVDRQGIPVADAQRVRVTKTGYLAGEAAAVTQTAAIVLDRAATLLVRVVDGSGKPIEKGTVTLVYASGRGIGPLPFNRAGMRTPSAPPGPVRVMAEAEGFDLAAPAAFTLEAGEEPEAVVRMTRR